MADDEPQKPAASGPLPEKLWFDRVAVAVSVLALTLSSITTYRQFFYESFQLFGSLETVSVDAEPLAFEATVVVYNPGTEPALVLSARIAFRSGEDTTPRFHGRLDYGPSILIEPRSIRRINVKFDDLFKRSRRTV